MKNKILILCPKFYPYIGGIEEQVRLLGDGFISMGYEVEVFTRRQEKSLKKYENLSGIHIRRFRNEIILALWLLKYSKQYLFIMSRHYYRNTLLLSILKTIGLVKTKTIICADSGGKNDEFVRIKKSFGILHKLYFRLVRHNNYLNCLNKDNEKHLKSIIGNSEKITRIYNGMDFSDVNYPRKIIINNILFISRLIPQKGIYETINAFKLIKNDSIVLNIAGSGSSIDEHKINNLIKEDKRINLLGPLYGAEKNSILISSDLLIFPSYTEGQSMLLLEAAKYNLPTITTDITDNREIFGDNLIYVEKENMNDLKQKIEYIISNIKDFNYNYDSIRKRMDINTICKTFVDLFLN